jgi:uncharacterized protein YhbP (UPF0306 family)
MSIPINKLSLYNFLFNHKSIAVSCFDRSEIWVCNLYFAVDDEFNMYFVSSSDSRHCKIIIANPNIAFANNSYNSLDLGDRNGVQGTGKCYILQDQIQIQNAIELYNKAFPHSKNEITQDWILNNNSNSHLWKITPKTIKFWSDEDYGNAESKEFKF